MSPAISLGCTWLGPLTECQLALLDAFSADISTTPTSAFAAASSSGQFIDFVDMDNTDPKTSSDHQSNSISIASANSLGPCYIPLRILEQSSYSTLYILADITSLSKACGIR